jgi:head decoration protein D
MDPLTEGQHTGEFILSESPGTISRDQVTVTVPTGRILAAGHVLALLSATGKYVPYDNSGSDGSEAARGILYSELDNAAGLSGTDITGVVVNFAAEVRKADLQWESGVDAAGKTAAYADLAAFGVKARD